MIWCGGYECACGFRTGLAGVAREHDRYHVRARDAWARTRVGWDA